MHPGFDEYVTALAFPEAARWHDGSLWFSDMHGGTVYRAPAAGEPVEGPVERPERFTGGR